MSSKTPQTIVLWLKHATRVLMLADVESARLDGLILLETVLEKPRSWLLAHDDTTLTPIQITKLNDLLHKREQRIPLAYIIGSKEFYGRKFIVNQDALIPRPESEAIIEILKELTANTSINTIIDIGTGSGCLAITAKLEMPDVHVSASDVSRSALVIAKKNATAHHTHIRFHHSDLFEALPRMPRTRPYVVLANLPYVPVDLITSPEINTEPASALFSGTDGMDHYRLFWKQIARLTNKPGHVLVENLQPQHKQMCLLAKNAGYFLKTRRDLVQHFVRST